AGRRAGLIGPLGANFAKKTVAPDLTTPDPVSLFSLLADMKREGVDVAVLEISAHALALRKECPIVYDVGIFTNLTQDHLDFFGTMKEYGEAKRKMFTPERCSFAVLNSDDNFYKTLKDQGVPFLSYGMENPADAFAVILSETVRGSKVLLNLSDDLIEVTLCMTGRHNVQNALAAAVAAKRLGASSEAISHGLNKVKGVDGRLEWVASYRGAEIFTDFAHTPDGLQKSLAALRKHCKGKLYCLFGCGGNRDKSKRPIMGATVAKGCDFAVITSDNPRFEDPCAIISDIESGYRSVSASYIAVEERERATEYALNLLGAGDILLVAGKGGETYQEIMGIKYSYNDKDVL
ncbi:MAG: UDP-N-acetylmuramoyl-L-alanyl-D-glutamate--2,6-diaminopimelate ligase, partial [Clostridiales bacterium]|nr:UDP-N-acetylmuramoyl-L-alanyl-D-glutamate--2,6-diaminopimelate ligase [Clostridiales bacterium]